MTDKSSLREIDSAYAELTQKQLDGKALPRAKAGAIEKAATITVAGFPVIDPEKMKRSSASYLAEVLEYANKRAALVTSLQKAGVAVLASLPSDSWHEICRQSELLVLQPIDGMVRFDRKEAAKALRKRVDNIYYPTYLFSAAAFAAMMMTLIIRGGGNFGDIALGTGIPTVGFLFVFGISGDLWTGLLFHLKAKNFITNYKLLSQFIDNGSGAYTKVILPEAPADVKATLLAYSKAKGFEPSELRVAAVPEAIKFNPPLGLMMKEELMAIKMEEARQRAMMDPIVFIERGGVVAIIAQFGDFPVEKALVQRLVKEEVVEQAY